MTRAKSPRARQRRIPVRLSLVGTGLLAGTLCLSAPRSVQVDNPSRPFRMTLNFPNDALAFEDVTVTGVSSMCAGDIKNFVAGPA